MYYTTITCDPLLKHSTEKINSKYINILIFSHSEFKPITIAAWIKANVILDSSSPRIKFSDPARDMDMCPHLSCAVFYRGGGLVMIWSPVIISKIIINWNRMERLNP
jgi:hypothetical protein